MPPTPRRFMTSFAHVALNCHDIATTEAFYTKHFGFRRARAVDLGGGKQIVFIKAGETYLELFQADAISPYGQPTNDGPTWPGVRHIAFQVKDVDAKIAEMGSEAKLSFGPFGFDAFIQGWRTAWVTDPDGTIVEISQGFTDDATLLSNRTTPENSRTSEKSPVGAA
jgi:glyoxylase I family protein